MRNQDRRYDVFLSHSSADKQAVKAVADRLREAGLDPFLDTWHLIPGTPWQEGTEEALAASTTAAVFVGPSGISPWHNEEMRDALDRAVRSRNDYRVIPVLLPGASEESISRFLARRVWVDFRPGLDDVEALQRLIAGIRGEAITPGAYQLPDEPAPYRGLLHFEAEHARFFFGREREQAELLDLLGQKQFVAVVGASGSGKSSLVRAGLLPKLAANALPDSSRWHTLLFTPGGQPLRSLAIQLATFVPLADRLRAADGLAQRLADHSDGLRSAVQVFTAAEPVPVLLVIDQFEEMFTLCAEGPERCRAEAERFIAVLADALWRGDGLIRVLITLRADFLDRCLTFPALRDLLQGGQYLLGSLIGPALQEAIVRPAQEAGAYFEKGLVSMILHDVSQQPGYLPLLEHALFELWQKRQGPWLTIDAYERSGGVAGALERRAQATYDALTSEQQAIARRVFLRLTALGEGASDTRRSVERSELYPVHSDRAEVDLVLQALSSEQTRLIVADDGSVEVAHEALIQHWPALRRWLEDNRDALRTQRRLTQVAQEWEDAKQDESYLYRGARLVEAEEWADQHPNELNALECEFLNSSIALRNAEATERETQRQKELATAFQLAAEAEERRRIESLRAEEQTRAAKALHKRATWLAFAVVISLALTLTAGVFGVKMYQYGEEMKRREEASSRALSFLRLIASPESFECTTPQCRKMLTLACGAIRVAQGEPNTTDSAGISVLNKRVMVASAAGNVRILSSGETSNIYSFDRVTVDETGRARIHFSDFLVIDVYRDEVGLAWNATVDPSAPPQFKMMLQGGSIFSNLTLNDIASARIKILRMNDTDWIIILAAGC